jgi:hypothetical protein
MRVCGFPDLLKALLNKHRQHHKNPRFLLNILNEDVPKGHVTPFNLRCRARFQDEADGAQEYLRNNGAAQSALHFVPIQRVFVCHIA